MAKKKTKSVPKGKKTVGIPAEGFLNRTELVEVVHNHDEIQANMTPAQRRVSEEAQRAMDLTVGLSDVVPEVERLNPGQYLVKDGRAFMHTHDRRVEDVTTYVNRLEKASIILASKLQDAENLARVRYREIERLEEAYDSVLHGFTAWQLLRQAFRVLFGRKRFA